jgi:hypothetical protein
VKDPATGEPRISSAGFVLASQDLITILENQQSPVFYPIRSRFSNDIEQIVRNYTTYPADQVSTLEGLLEHEKAVGCKVNHESDQCTHATWKLVMLVRGYVFLLDVFHVLMENPNAALTETFQTCYKRTLGKYHMEYEKKIFHAVMYACPNRQSFFTRLAGRSGNIDSMYPAAKAYFAELKTVVMILCPKLKQQGFEIA